MKEKKGPDPLRFIRRINSHEKIDQLASDLKEFLKETHNIKHEYTFEEINDSIKNKRIDESIKVLIEKICSIFVELEYRPKKPSKKELSVLKKHFRDLVKSKAPAVVEKKPQKTYLAKIKRKKERHEKIVHHVEFHQSKIQKKAQENAREAIAKKIDDKEIRTILKFIHTSVSVGQTRNEVKKELREMGFTEQKIKVAFKNYLPPSSY